MLSIVTILPKYSFNRRKEKKRGGEILGTCFGGQTLVLLYRKEVNEPLLNLSGHFQFH